MDTSPHIILITSDQQRFDTIRAGGASWMHTPALDQLSEDGVLLSHLFAPAATCVSSRCAFWTGMYPHRSGVYGFNKWTGKNNWTHLLKRVGYHTASVGKTHIGGCEHGLDQRVADMRNKQQPDYTDLEKKIPSEWVNALSTAGFAPPYNVSSTDPFYYDKLAAETWSLPEELHYDSWIGQRSVKWIEKHTWDTPSFLHIGFLGPHEPYDPSSRFLEYYEDSQIPVPSRDSSEIENMPAEIFALNERLETAEGDSVIRTSRATDNSIIRMRKHYYANISQIDEQIGEIIEALKKAGVYESSLIIFTSDHGDNLFDHNLLYKGDLYDSSVRVPGIVKFPGNKHIQKQNCDSLLSQLDLAVWLLKEAGVPEYELERLDGVDAGPVLRN
jgi:arylsulfatase A-like enzyme